VPNTADDQSPDELRELPRDGAPPTPERVRPLSIVLLFYDEEEVAADVVREALAVGSSLGPFELVLVDDGSRDGTPAILDSFASGTVRVVRHETNRGYGAALRSGLRAARMPWVFYTDGDGQFDLRELPSFLRSLDRADVVIGYRERRADPFVRRALGRAWSALTDAALGTGARDVNCAYKVFPRSLLRRMTLESDGALIDAELLASVRRAGATIAEVPVQHRPRGSGHPTGAKPAVIARALGELAALVAQNTHPIEWTPDPLPALTAARAEKR